MINNYNIRILMTMFMNIYRNQNNLRICEIIFKILISQKDKKNIYSNFFNIKFLDKRIEEIENLIGFEINEDIKLDNKEYYNIGDDFFSICNIWNPVIFLYGTYRVANRHINKDGTIFRMINYSKFEDIEKYIDINILLPSLSDKEKNHNTKITPGIFFLLKNEYETLTNLIRQKYKKYSVGNDSGHTLLHMDLIQYFLIDNSKKNINLMILACIIWMVPFDHSINEILKAVQYKKLFDYNMKETSYDNIIKIIENII